MAVDKFFLIIFSPIYFGKIKTHVVDQNSCHGCGNSHPQFRLLHLNSVHCVGIHCHASIATLIVALARL